MVIIEAQEGTRPLCLLISHGSMDKDAWLNPEWKFHSSAEQEDAAKLHGKGHGQREGKKLGHNAIYHRMQ